MPTVDELYEAFMDKDKSFGEDIFDFFGYEMGTKGWDVDEWTKEYGVYLPTFDPAGIKLAKREKEVDYKKAMDTLDITQRVADRVYATELDTLSTELGREMEKGKTIAGGLGLRSGFVESAVEDTLQRSSTKTKDLGDRLMLSEEEMLNTYNAAMVDAALDFDKTKRQEKEDFYDRTLGMITRLGERGAFDCKNTGEVWCDKLSICAAPEVCAEGYCSGGVPHQCSNGTCVNSECDCPEMADSPSCIGDPGVGDQPPGGDIADAAYCTQICTPYAGLESGGMTCYDSCLGTPTMGEGAFTPQLFNWIDRAGAEANCPDGDLQWNTSTGNLDCIPSAGSGYAAQWCSCVEDHDCLAWKMFASFGGSCGKKCVYADGSACNECSGC